MYNFKKNKMKKFNLKLLIVMLITFTIASCSKDFLDTNPGEFAGSDQLKSSPSAGEASLNGLYSFLSDQTLSTRDDYFGLHSILITTDLMGSDMVQVLHHWLGWDYLVGNRSSNYSRTRNNWNFLYRIVNISNNIISNSPIDSEIDNVRYSAGQGYVMRAYAYHYLIRLYQHTYNGHQSELGVPLYLESDIDGKPRASVSEVYAQMVNDLKTAIAALEGFSRPNKTIINQSVAKGILARVYLDMGEWLNAATMASEAREGFSLMTASDYKKGFNDINNSEWMWGIDMNVEAFAEEGKYQTFISHIASNIPGYAGLIGAHKAIDKKLYNLIPSTDERKNVFDVGNLHNKKFIDGNEDFTSDLVLMRVAEMYLIEAEAKAHLGPGGANVLFELVKTRDPGYILSTNSGSSLVEEVWIQRRIELWGEGFSWFDLKRLKKGFDRNYTGTNHRSDALLTVTAEDQKTFVYQLPNLEFESNPNLPDNQQNK